MLARISCGLMCVALAVLQAVQACVYGQQPAPDLSELEKTAREEMLETRTPGAALIVVSGDRIVFQKGFGVASVETSDPVTVDTLFQIGSMTKLFTAATLLSLAGTGRVALDEPVGKHLKDLSPKLSQVTPRQLLSHTAGLKDEPDEYGLHDETALSAYVRSWKDDYCLFEPGRTFSYSNSGFALAGLVIEDAGARPYADQIAETLFKPLGMSRSTFRPTDAMTHPFAVGHRVRPNEAQVVVRPAADDSRLWPAGGIYSTAGELARFAIAFLNGGRLEGKEVVSPKVIEAMMKPVAEIPAERQRYGQGMFIYDHRAVRVVEHEGSMPGFFGLLRMVPEKRFAVVILSNLESGVLRKTAEKAMELMIKLAPTAERTVLKPLPMSDAEIASYAGVYWQPNRWSIELLAKDGKLYIKQFGSELPVTKIGEHRFAVSRPGSAAAQEFELAAGPDGKPDLLQMFVWAFKRK